MKNHNDFTVNVETHSRNVIIFVNKFAGTLIIESVTLSVLLQFCCAVG